jgi:hypothetical protein
MTRSDPTPSTGKRHPIVARVFARAGPAMDAQGALDPRRALLAGLAGRVLEVGIARPALRPRDGQQPNSPAVAARLTRPR